MATNQVTKGQIYDLITDSGLASAKTFVIEKIEEIKENSSNFPSDRAITKSLDKVKENFKTVIKNKKRASYEIKLNDLREEVYQFPKATDTPTKQPLLIQTSGTKTGRLNQSLSESYYMSTVAMGKENMTLKTQNESLKRKCDNQEQLMSEMSKMRKTEFVYKQEQAKRIETSKQNKILTKQNRILAKKATERRLTMKRTKLQISYYCRANISLRDKIKNLTTKVTELETEVEEKDALLDELRSDKSKLIGENEDMQGILIDNTVVNTFDGSKYTTDMQQAVYALLESHVSTHQIKPVVEAVCRLVGKSVSHIPSRSTINNMNIQRLLLAHQQLGEQIGPKLNLTLLSDETTKYDRRLEGIHCADSDGRQWVLGLREIETKSAQNCYQTFQEILGDIDRACDVTDSDISKQILVNIVARMSDRAATELKLGQLVENARLELLPIIREGYSDLSDLEKQEVGQLLVFSCGLHGLVHFAETANATLLECEKSLFDANPRTSDVAFVKPGESATVGLIRTCSKAFARGGDEKSGCHLEFSSYIRPFLQTYKLHTLPLSPFKGNRFNILFANADHIFFLKDQLTEFLEGRDNNRLLKAVLHDLKTPELLAGCKSLGLVSKYISTPLWTLIEDKSIHVLDMSSRYQGLVNSLKYASLHPGEFMQGKVLPFGDATPVNEDCFLDALLKPFDHDHIVQSVLAVMLPALAKLCEKLYKDHLDGAKYSDIEKESKLYQMTTGVPKHNKFSESAFGYIDGLMKVKPNISSLSCEAYIMFCKNQTKDWLDEKSQTEIESMLSSARRDRKSVLCQFHQRRDEIREARRAETLQKQQQTEQARQTKLKQLETYTQEIVLHGLWQSEEEVTRMVKLYPTQAQKTNALKIQIRFRKHVLQQDADKSLFKFSKGGKATSVAELAQNVIQLIENSGCRTDDSDHIIVGKEIEHKFNVSASGEQQCRWFHGKVLSQVRGYPQWFNVKYVEEDPIYTFKLLEDLEKGDIRILHD